MKHIVAVNDDLPNHARQVYFRLALGYDFHSDDLFYAAHSDRHSRVFAFFTNGFLLALAAGIQPGPFQTFLINTALTIGWRRGLPAIFSPLIVDGPIILIVVFLFGALPDVLINLIRIAGGLLLLWIAWGAAGQLRAQTPDDSIPSDQTDQPLIPEQAVLLKAMGMNFLSPGPYLFWSTVNGPLLLDGLRQSLLHGLAFLIGFYGTFLMILFLTLLLFDRLGRLDARLTRGALLLTTAIMALFGAALVLQGATALF